MLRQVPLVVDPDRDFLRSLAADPIAAEIPPMVTEVGRLGQLMLADTSKEYLGIFVNLDLADQFGYSILRFSQRYRPFVPKIVLQNENTKDLVSMKELRRLGVRGVLKKPVSYSQIIASIKNLDFDPSFADAVPTFTEASFEKDEFISIQASTFLSGSKSLFDVYVRLPNNRTIKILKAGEEFPEQRLATYIQKGVTHFYLRKEAQEMYLHYCDTLVSKLVKHSKIQSKTKIAHALNFGKEVEKIISDHGVKPSFVKYAKNFAASAHAIAEDLRAKSPDNPYLSGFLSDIASCEHGVGVSLVASMLGGARDLNSTRSVEILGVASLFHDVGLRQLPESARSEDISTMDLELRNQFINHPIFGAEILKACPGVELVAIQAVLQHHERRNRQGFPFRLGVGSIHPVSEILGLADEFVRLALSMKDKPKEEVLVAAQTEILPAFSSAAADAFKAVFIDKTEGPED